MRNLALTLKQLLKYVIVYIVLLIVPDEPVASTSSNGLGKRKRSSERKNGPKNKKKRGAKNSKTMDSEYHALIVYAELFSLFLYKF